MKTLYRQVVNDTPLAEFKLDKFGNLRKKARIARVGIYNYLDEKGEIVRELIPEDELRAVDFSNQVLTLDHPPIFVDTENSQSYQVGMTGEMSFNNGWLEGIVTVTRQYAIDEAQKEARYFSTGYHAEVDPTPGIWVDKNGVMGEKGKSYPYDSVQRKLVPNHVALVTNPRAGKQATYINSKTGEFTIIQNDIKSVNSMKIIHNEEVYEIEGENAKDVKALITNMKKEMGDMSKKMASMEKEMSMHKDKDKMKEDKKNSLEIELETLKGQKDALEAKITELEAQPKLNADDVNKLVNEKVAVWQVVQNSLDASAIELDTLDIKKAYLVKLMPNLTEKINSGSDVYVSALWDARASFEPKSNSETVKEDLLAAKAETASQAKENSDDQLAEAFAAAKANYFTFK